ncbi:ANTAR domain-containing protein [Cellulomonas sp. 179-A 4D5 NHS]|uniref:ANTAR domain-containing protein n=1 Tax=Cellulomonas sp. 179-A 4D5 NHS TaxID=3142378 RepID=UPI00399F03B8
MEPVPGTTELLRSLRESGAGDVEGALRELAGRVADVVPSCVGVSLSVAHGGLTFTLASTSDDTAGLDAVQYLAGGPCVETALEDVEIELGDLLDEERWQRFAVAAAASGVRSTLSLPLSVPGMGPGSVNVYAADEHAFVGTRDALREIVGEGVDVAVTNADLPFRTRTAAAAGPQNLRALDVVEQAVGYLMASEQLDADRARARLTEAAERAGTDLVTVARTLVGGG